MVLIYERLRCWGNGELEDSVQDRNESIELELCMYSTRNTHHLITAI